MIPLHLDPQRLSIGLAGVGALAERRLGWLHAGHCKPLVFSPEPSASFRALAADSLVGDWPDASTLDSMDILWIADLPPAQAATLYDQARTHKVIVNVEDNLPYCDFHTPAVVRRGHLLISIGTGGASPAVSGAVRERIETAVSTAWGPLLDEIAEARRVLMAAHASPQTLAQDARDRIARAGL